MTLRRAFTIAALATTLAWDVSGGAATAAPAEPTEPSTEWVQTSEDSVVPAATLRAMAAAQRQFQSQVYGDGFNAFDNRNTTRFTIRLVTSHYGNIEEYRDELERTAAEIGAIGGAEIHVAAETVVEPADPNNLEPAQGEIYVMIAKKSPCGKLEGAALGCGGPYGGVYQGELLWSSGVVWLRPNMAASCRQIVTTHEISHALGLSHYDAKYPGPQGVSQVMKSSTNCVFPIELQSGDINGHRWLVSGRPYNDDIASAQPVCPVRHTTFQSVQTYLAHAETGEPAHAGIPAQNSVWFRYTAQSAGAMRVNVALDHTTVAVYTSPSFAGAVPIASHGWAGLNDPAEVNFEGVVGATYWIAVNGQLGDTFGGYVEFYPPEGASPILVDGVPARFLDTRNPGGQTFDCNWQATYWLAAGATLYLPVASRHASLSSATSVVLNVTVVAPNGPGYLTVYPCGQTRPNASSLNFAAGDVVANLVISKLGPGQFPGSICIYTSTLTDLIVDFDDYFDATDAFVTLSPARLLDTRIGGQTVDELHKAVGRLVPGVPYELPIGGRVPVDASAATVVLNVTALNPAAAGYVTVYPCGQAPPNASNLNFAAGDTIPNLVIAKVGASGKVCFVSSTSTDLLVDVGGYWLVTPELVPLESPGRLLDTRVGGQTVDHLDEGIGRIAAGATYELPVLDRAMVPAGGVKSVVLNVTAVNPNGSGYLTVYPCGSARPNASNLNFVAGDVIPNSVIARVGTDGKVCIFSSAQTDLLVDVSAYFTN